MRTYNRCLMEATNIFRYVLVQPVHFILQNENWKLLPLPPHSFKIHPIVFLSIQGLPQPCKSLYKQVLGSLGQDMILPLRLEGGIWTRNRVTEVEWARGRGLRERWRGGQGPGCIGPCRPWKGFRFYLKGHKVIKVFFFSLWRPFILRMLNCTEKFKNIMNIRVPFT